MTKSVDEYYNSYHRSFWKINIDADYSALTENIELSNNVPNFKVGDRVRLTRYKNIFRKSDTENRSNEILAINFVLKTYPWTYKIKDVIGKKLIGSFYEK